MSNVSIMLETIEKANCDKTHAVPDKFKHAVIGISDETGELNQILKRAMYYGDKIDNMHVLEEYGDILYYVILDCIRIAADWSLDVEQVFACIFDMNAKKLKARYPEGFSEEKATELGRDRELEKAAMDKPDAGIAKLKSLEHRSVAKDPATSDKPELADLPPGKDHVETIRRGVPNDPKKK